MTIGRQIRIVLWKNFTIRRRRLVCRRNGLDLCKITHVLSCDLVSGDLRISLAAVPLSHPRLDSKEKFNLLLRLL